MPATINTSKPKSITSSANFVSTKICHTTYGSHSSNFLETIKASSCNERISSFESKENLFAEVSSKNKHSKAYQIRCLPIKRVRIAPHRTDKYSPFWLSLINEWSAKSGFLEGALESEFCLELGSECCCHQGSNIETNHSNDVLDMELRMQNVTLEEQCSIFDKSDGEPTVNSAAEIHRKSFDSKMTYSVGPNTMKCFSEHVPKLILSASLATVCTPLAGRNVDSVRVDETGRNEVVTIAVPNSDTTIQGSVENACE